MRGERPLLVLICMLSFVSAGISNPSKQASQEKRGSALAQAAAAVQAGRDEEALSLLDAAEKSAPKKPEIPNMRGAILARQKQFDRAEQQYKEALALDPKFYLARLNLADLDLLRGEYSEAKQEFAELQNLDPDSELLQFKRVLCAVLGGDKASAEGIVIGMKFPGQTPAYYYSRAAIALSAGQTESAKKYFANVKKYYSEGQCAYFAQSLRDVGLTLQSAPAPSATPGPSTSPSPAALPAPVTGPIPSPTAAP